MEFKKGDILDLIEDKSGINFVTTNAMFNYDGSLSMNKGAAGELIESCGIELSQEFGKMIIQKGKKVRNQYGKEYFKYGTLYLPEKKIGIFQIKYHYKDEIDFGLLHYSCAILLGIARSTKENININNIGGTNQEERSKIINILASYFENEENVFIWRLDRSAYED